MAELQDPLSLLREYTINKKVIIEKDYKIIFGELSFPKNAVTNYQKNSGCSGRKKKLQKDLVKEYYTLESLLFLLKNENLFHVEYFNVAAAAGIPHVRRPDRKQLLSYLKGETATSDAINKTVKLEVIKTEADIPVVCRPDRKHLTGETATSDAEDKTVKLEVVKTEADIPVVCRPDRKHLTGETATSDAEDKTVKLEVVKTEKRSHEQDTEESEDKKPRIK